MNVTEFPKPRKDEPEPEWVRNNDATPVGGGLLLQVDKNAAGETLLAAMCEGELLCCIFCGANLPLWPVTEHAKHVLDVHRENLTLQAEQTYTQQLAPGITPLAGAIMQAQLILRVSLRRQAWKLGIAKVVNPDEGGSPILRPGWTNPRRMQ